MMSSRQKMILLSGFFSLFLILALSTVQADTDSPKPIEKQRPPVAFTHVDHMDFVEDGCLDCHHRYEDGENILDEGDLGDYDSDIIMLNVPSDSLKEVNCASCHNNDNKEIKLDSMDAFHAQCIGCHEKMAVGPVLCGECHINSNQASADE